MRRRGRLLLGVGAVVLMGVAAIALLLGFTDTATTPGVTWENYRGLREGMSASEVESMLGKPHFTSKSLFSTLKTWQSDEVTISLTFDGERLKHGLAHPPLTAGQDLSSVQHLERIRKPEGFLDCFRRRFGW